MARSLIVPMRHLTGADADTLARARALYDQARNEIGRVGGDMLGCNLRTGGVAGENDAAALVRAADLQVALATHIAGAAASIRVMERKHGVSNDNLSISSRAQHQGWLSARGLISGLLEAAGEVRS